MSFSLHDEFTRVKFLRWEFLFIQKGLEVPPHSNDIIVQLGMGEAGEA